MRKFTFSLVLVLLSVVAFSQNVIVPQHRSAQIMKGIAIANDQAKTPIDTLMWTEFFFDSPVFYGYTGGGFVFGTNIAGGGLGSKKCAQGFQNFNPSLAIEQILAWVGEKSAVGGNSNLVMTLNLLDDSSSYGSTGGPSYDIRCPGTVIASVTQAYADIDTADLAVFTLTTPVVISSDFAVVADVTNFYTNGDSIGFMTSYDGGASANQGVEFTWWEYPSSTENFWVEYDHVFDGGDNLIAFFPVVSDYVGILENPEFVNGVKLNQNFPNPSVNGTTSISYALETSSNVTLSIIDIQGRTIEVVNPGFQAAGVYTTSLNTNLNAGVYYYSLEACGTRLTKKMVVK